MKAEVHIDIQEFVTLISEVLLKELKPLLEKGTVETEVLFTVKTLAKYLHVSDQWVYERVHLRELPFIRVGKFPRFRKADIDRWLDSHTVPVSYPLSSSLKPRLKTVEKVK